MSAEPVPLITIGQPTGPRNATTDPRTGLRFYTWRGRRLPSVTSIRRLAGLPHGLHQWSIGKVVDRALEESASVAATVARGDPAALALVRHRLRDAATAERDAAAALGTAVHAAAADRRSLAEVGPDVAPRLRQYLDWLATSKAEILATEFQCWNLGIGYAGTADLLVRFPDQSIWLVDLKTGKGVYGEHALQLLAYLMAEFVGTDDVVDDTTTEYLKAATGLAVLHLEADKWEFHSLRADMETWAAFRGLLAFGSWLFEHGTIEKVTVASRKGSAA
jgi:hypothetical protein